VPAKDRTSRMTIQTSRITRAERAQLSSPTSSGSGLRSEAEYRGRVVCPGFMHPDLSADCREGAVAGLVGDGPIACAAHVCIGDEPSPQAVSAIWAGIQAGTCHGGLHEIVDRLWMQAMSAPRRTRHRPERSSSRSRCGRCRRSHVSRATGPHNVSGSTVML
jgi:hypothetical protein